MSGHYTMYMINEKDFIDEVNALVSKREGDIPYEYRDIDF
jgi:hypothetical protein